MHGGGRIDQHRVALGPARQKQRRRQRIAIRRRQRDIVDEYVVQPRLGYLMMRMVWMVPVAGLLAALLL